MGLWDCVIRMQYTCVRVCVLACIMLHAQEYICRSRECIIAFHEIVVGPQKDRLCVICTPQRVELTWSWCTW